jgi:hypothetical protein
VRPEPAAGRRSGKAHAVSDSGRIGRRRTLRPVARASALATAGAITGVATSPRLAGGSALGAKCTSIAGVLIALPVVLVFGHPYDVVLLVPLLAVLGLRLVDRRMLWPVGAALAVALILPDRLTARLGAPQGQWVTLAALPLVAWVLALGYRAVRRYSQDLVPADS